ncbi:hypothetical protein O181_068638 [Austropuccinia psidii MF-1]|uniref:Uncharacterized protein n=1 Tax=Austropuccinia psidii MF-1 TaxID=1389203 RepID=A0A9Q3I5L7_9BASI|nr:hypothetical protein [Austropuccinia psidii MF-1]
MPIIPYAWPGSQRFRHQFLFFYRVPNIQNPYASAASQKFQHFLMPVQAPNTSHVYPYACTGSQKFKQFRIPVQASNASQANTYACTGYRRFTHTSSHLHRFLRIQTIPYAGKPPDNSKNSLHY